MSEIIDFLKALEVMNVIAKNGDVGEYKRRLSNRSTSQGTCDRSTMARCQLIEELSSGLLVGLGDHGSQSRISLFC